MTLSSATSRDLDMELGVHRRCVCNIESRMTNISEFVFNCQHHPDHPSNQLEKITKYMSCWVCEELWKSGLGALAFGLMSVVSVQGRVRSGESHFLPANPLNPWIQQNSRNRWNLIMDPMELIQFQNLIVSSGLEVRSGESHFLLTNPWISQNPTEISGIQ